MRFHVPNNEVDQFYEERKRARNANKKVSAEESEDESDNGEEVTAAKLFNDKIVMKAKIG